MSSRARLPFSPEPRGAPRHKVFLPAEMAGAGGGSRVHLLNLSPAGALVHGDVAPSPGAVVQLNCRGASWIARVVWSQHKRFGVVHVTPLAGHVMQTLVAGQTG